MSRELLERAAKAAGFVLVWGDKYKVGDDEIDCTDIPYIRIGQPDEGDVYWNPIDDDGDAFRLAVKLRLVPHPFAGSDADNMDFACCYEPRSKREFEEKHNGDPAAATRLAIVRAAAAMGEKP